MCVQQFQNSVHSVHSETMILRIHRTLELPQKAKQASSPTKGGRSSSNFSYAIFLTSPIKERKKNISCQTVLMTIVRFLSFSELVATRFQEEILLNGTNLVGGKSSWRLWNSHERTFLSQTGPGAVLPMLRAAILFSQRGRTLAGEEHAHSRARCFAFAMFLAYRAAEALYLRCPPFTTGIGPIFRKDNRQIMPTRKEC